MDLFLPYKNTIATALRSNNINKSINETASHQRIMFSLHDFQETRASLVISDDLIKIATAMKVQPIKEQIIGHHPDFKYLKHTGKTEKHNIVSVFIDIKGSTNLFKRYSPDRKSVV